MINVLDKIHVRTRTRAHTHTHTHTRTSTEKTYTYIKAHKYNAFKENQTNVLLDLSTRLDLFISYVNKTMYIK